MTVCETEFRRSKKLKIMLSLPLITSRYGKMYERIPSWNDIEGYARGLPVNQNVTKKRVKFVWDIIGLLGILFLVFVFYMLVNPPLQYFKANDPSLSYPFVESHVSSILVALLSIMLPIIIILLFHVFLVWDIRDLYSGILGAILAYCISLLITSSLWYFVGGLRPHFLSLCTLDPTRISDARTYYTQNDCQESDFITRDTFHGFPSGHASTAFAGCVYLSAYLAAHLKLYKNGNIFKVFVVLLPWICAIWLAASRISDHHHSVIQVLAGILIGIISALFAYKIVYVHGFFLGHGKWAHIPYMRYDM